MLLKIELERKDNYMKTYKIVDFTGSNFMAEDRFDDYDAAWDILYDSLEEIHGDDIETVIDHYDVVQA